MRFDPSEHSIQATLVGVMAYKMRPGLVQLAIPNGGMRHPIVGKKLKEEGLLPGSPDLVYALEAGRTLWLEMKKRKGRLSDDQIGLHYKLTALGHLVETAYSLDEALDILDRHGVLK